MSLEAKLEAAGKEFQKVQSDLSKAVENRQKLESQLQENEIVQKEFKLLKDDANVFKLIGPVLVKQDRPEATANVDKRIEYITAEIKRVETQIKDLSERQDKKRQELQELQIAFQEAKSKQ